MSKVVEEYEKHCFNTYVVHRIRNLVSSTTTRPSHPLFVYPNEKSLIERTMQYIKDRIAECFDDYFPCRRKKKCKLKHEQNWLNLFLDYHNKELGLK